jgi:hypothetical protein
MLLPLCEIRNKKMLRTFLQGETIRKYWVTSVLILEPQNNQSNAEYTQLSRKTPTITENCFDGDINLGSVRGCQVACLNGTFTQLMIFLPRLAVRSLGLSWPPGEMRFASLVVSLARTPAVEHQQRYHRYMTTSITQPFPNFAFINFHWQYSIELTSRLIL